MVTTVLGSSQVMQPGQAATSVLRGRPRGLLRGTISPRRNSSPPQTPHGSLRSTAPARQAIRAGQPRHSDLAYSTSCGDSAKNNSGSSPHGRSRPLGTPAIAVGLATGTAAGPVPVILPASADCASNPASNPAGPSNTAAVPGQCIGAIPSHLLVLRSLTRLTKRWPRMTKAADPISGPRPREDQAGRSRPDPSPNADPKRRR